MFGDNISAYQTVFKALAISLGFSPTSETAARMIVRAYSDPPSVQNQRLENCCFFDLTPDLSVRMLVEKTRNRGSHFHFRYMPYMLNCVFYGPEAERNALIVRENLFVDGIGKPLAVLRQAGMYPVPPVQPPMVVYEEDRSLYRKRVDLVIRMKIRDNSDEGDGNLPAEMIQSTPEVVVHDNDRV